ncbi:glycosyltransferase [Corynebacterium renale]|uniref:glycosyltransferase family 4 protein n=1 Tax=Corynebacterium renale TaxID=1724 RepID=UPI000DA29E6B|nr:glycosyltransferase family 4 protein [Corynebacterium renale]SQG64802.1 glycosyltransferase [Corynebacterium renale]STC96300.1 glycosyltransferase [Corynebacterium renale]
MKVGIVCPYSFDEPGGVQAHIIDLARALKAKGHEVSVLGPASTETQLPDFVVKGGPAIAVPYNGSVARISFGPHVINNLKKFVCEEQLDVLHIHEPNSPSYSMAAAMYCYGNLVATYHASTKKSRVLKLALPFLRPFLEKIRAGIAVSEMARRWQVEALGGDPILIPNGVHIRDYAQFRKLPNPHQREPFEIVFLGRLDEPRKGLKVLLKALTLLDREVKVTVMGAGESRTVPGVTFAGKVSDEEKQQILGRADIYVAPNTGGESFGIVLVEAMAAGCAVVASDIEAFSLVCEADSSNPAGVIFKNGSPHDLARRLQELIDKPQRMRDVAERGVTRAKDFDWATIADQIVTVYETIDDGHGVRL